MCVCRCLRHHSTAQYAGIMRLAAHLTRPHNTPHLPPHTQPYNPFPLSFQLPARNGGHAGARDPQAAARLLLSLANLRGRMEGGIGVASLRQCCCQNCSTLDPTVHPLHSHTPETPSFFACPGILLAAATLLVRWNARLLSNIRESFASAPGIRARQARDPTWPTTDSGEHPGGRANPTFIGCCRAFESAARSGGAAPSP